MKFSLLVPCYNAECFIEGFLRNISELILPFDEILFYDDASTDNTTDILSSKGYKVIKGNSNRGPGYARNVLAEHASGDYLHFHDIDDLLRPDFLEKSYEILQQTEYDVILCNVDWYDSNLEKIILSWKYSNRELNNNPLPYIISHPVGGINGLYRRSVFLNTGGFNTNLRIWEDADMHVKLASKAGVTFKVIEEVLSLSVRYSTSLSSNQSLGWVTRFELLQQYYNNFTDKTVREAIGQQAQITASSLIMCGLLDVAKKALQLSEHCRVKVPQSKNYPWKVLKRILPARVRIGLRMLQLRHAFRHHSASNN
ncbi:glycosyl transferase family 2 [Mucilaginibacter yixingensis]|uniref:Glycosyl transferase family 2 n=1 Tax=Mucilaginibacter yixingensis TaxID=1295612 RepID=A0A2T5JFS5_9SPHI|nr:glycosyltransferase family 2 protein [Mucilaginibacter yixingensis]PTR01278.1 glycosyl transferase family 2 [Mucilaginibacter yixingensis]